MNCRTIRDIQRKSVQTRKINEAIKSTMELILKQREENKLKQVQQIKQSIKLANFATMHDSL